jgi:[ribosomal protein S5]-alanine N-acetyltransferase
MADPKSPQYFNDIKNIFNTSTVTGDRIYLRRLQVTDINDLYVSYYQHAELIKYMYQTPRKIDREHLVNELATGEESNNFHMYGVFDKTNDLCIGNIRVGYMTHAHKISDLAIFIGNPAYLGKGLATEAIKLGNQLCFEKYDFRKLHGGMFEENMASVKAYMKTGWVVEGRLRGQYLVDDQRMDRISVACFNPKYFSESFLAKVSADSERYLQDYI